MKIFPRLIAAEHHADFKREPVSSGLKELDALFGGGLDRGTTTLMPGPAGSGQGSTFTVELPALAAGAAGTAADPAGSPGTDCGAAQSKRPMRLLVVEDDEPTQQVLTRFLTRDGHQVVRAATLREARLAAAGQYFDAVISDLGLPDGTGIELMKDLRERHGLRGIVLSGYGMEEDLRRSQEAGFAAPPGQAGGCERPPARPLPSLRHRLPDSGRSKRFKLRPVTTTRISNLTAD